MKPLRSRTPRRKSIRLDGKQDESLARQSKRQDTTIESEGAEFLVLGQLLIRGITAYKTYARQPEYDVVAINPDRHKSVARISVKSRWTTTATGFLLKSLDCDFVVLVKLNRGSKDGSAEVRPPEYFILPAHVLRRVPRSKGWNKISFGSIPGFKTYQDRWDLISQFLQRRKKRPNERKETVGR